MGGTQYYSLELHTEPESTVVQIQLPLSIMQENIRVDRLQVLSTIPFYCQETSRSSQYLDCRDTASYLYTLQFNVNTVTKFDNMRCLYTKGTSPYTLQLNVTNMTRADSMMKSGSRTHDDVQLALNPNATTAMSDFQTIKTVMRANFR